MGLLRFYLHKDKLVIPTVCETEAGFFVDQSPITIVAAKNRDRLKPALLKVISSPNKLIPTPEATDTPGSIILERLVIDSWTEFEKDAVLYTVHKGARYTTLHVAGKGSDGMWTMADSVERKFDRRAPVESIAEAVMEDIALQMSKQEVKPMLLLPGPTLGNP